MYKTLTDYNERNNTPLSNENFREAIRKFIKEESIADVNDITGITFSHTSNTQIDHTKTIFTIEKLDKLDKQADTLKDLTINDAKYYESNTVTVSNTQDDHTRNPETFTHTSNGNETVTHNINGNFEQNLLRNWTIPVVFPTMNLRIDQILAPIVVAPQMLLTPKAKEVIPDKASVGE